MEGSILGGGGGGKVGVEQYRRGSVQRGRRSQSLVGGKGWRGALCEEGEVARWEWSTIGGEVFREEGAVRV